MSITRPTISPISAIICPCAFIIFVCAHYLVAFMIPNSINKVIEWLFVRAIAGSKTAIFIIKSSSLVTKIPLALWYFRKGDISRSLKLLKQVKIKTTIVEHYSVRAQEILNELNSDSVLSRSDILRLRSFNGRILFVVHSSGFYHNNGYAQRTAHLLKTLNSHDLEVGCMTRYGYPWDLLDSRTQEIVSESNFKGHRYRHTFDPEMLIGKSENEYLEAYKESIGQNIMENEYTAVHSHSSYINGIAGALAAREAKVTSYYEVRGLWHKSRAFKEPGYDRTEHYQYCEQMEIKAAQLNDRVITLNRPLKDWLVKKGVDQNKIVIIPNGAHIDVRSFQSSGNYTHSHELVLGYIGTLTAYEGLDDVLVAMKMLSDNDIKVSLKVAGTGPYENNLRKQVKRLGLRERVDFLGFLSGSQKTVFFDSIDVFMLVRKASPMTELVSPLKLPEAMSYGKTTIVSDLAALTSTDSKGDRIVVNPNSPESIVRAIEEISANPRILHQVGKKAIDNVIKKSNWAMIGKTYYKLYHEKI